MCEENSKGYYYIEQDEDTKKWNVCCDIFDVINSYELESEAQKEVNERNEKIKETITSFLKTELSKYFIVNEDYFEFKCFSYDITYSVLFVNKVGTEFNCCDIFFNEEKLEVLQFLIEVNI